MVKIGSFECGKKPGIVAVLDEIILLEELDRLKSAGVDLLELRVDLIPRSLRCIVSYINDIHAAVGIPIIGTIRETDANKNKRVEMFKAIMGHIDCVDIELGSPISSEVIAIADGKTIMVSEHDFNKTPTEAELQSIMDRSIDQGAEIVKIATMAHDYDDVRRLLKFIDVSEVPLVAFAMGEKGALSRLIAPLFGSLFTYGYLKKAVAPGQLSVTKLLEERALYYR
jgi:3-dehydroquinate dehydratase-1